MMRSLTLAHMLRVRRSMMFLSMAMIFGLCAGCGEDKGFDPKSLSQGDTPEISQANNAMEDFMKNQSKSQTPKK